MRLQLQPEAVVAIAFMCLGMLLLIGAAVLMLVVIHNRRIKHRAQLAELALAHDREVMDAEREGQRLTLQEVGRELHDNLGQLLTVVQMGLHAELEDDATRQRLHEAVGTLEQGIEEVRRMGRSLNSDVWSQRTFTEAIIAEKERIERMGLARMPLTVKGEPPHLSADTKTILFRVFQEAVNNALKHAHADTITVALRDGGPVELTITDNGRGFAAADAPGTGLNNIRRRCELIGFHAQLTTSPGQGTTWRITRPDHAA